MYATMYVDKRLAASKEEFFVESLKHWHPEHPSTLQKIAEQEAEIKALRREMEILAQRFELLKSYRT